MPVLTQLNEKGATWCFTSPTLSGEEKHGLTPAALHEK